jgi:6-phosphogluconolactonase
MNGRIEQVGSVPDAFAQLVVDRLASVGDSAGASLFLSGGSTAQKCYRSLAEQGRPGVVDWSAVDVYLGDERCVPLHDPDSNHKMIADTLLDRVAPVRSDHPMYEAGSPEAAAATYQQLLEPLAAFDFVHLGLGPDGHTASLFPGSTALDVDDPGLLVVANRDPRGNNPHDRITLTLAGIARARLVVFTVDEASKRKTFQRLVDGEDLPAGRVTADEVVWLVDASVTGTELPPA